MSETITYPIREYYYQQVVTKQLYQSDEWDKALEASLKSCKHQIENDEHFFRIVKEPTVEKTFFYADWEHKKLHYPTSEDEATLVELHIHGFVAGTWPAKEGDDDDQSTEES